MNAPPPIGRAEPVLVAILAALVALLSGCSPSPVQPPRPADVVRVGAANFPENRVLAEIYAQALERRGAKVERRFDTGNRETYLPALQDGSIDVIPEYTGNLLQYLDRDATDTMPDPVYRRLVSTLDAPLRPLTPSRAENKDAVVVTRAYAAQNNVRSIDDLARHCRDIVFGGPPEFPGRPDGLPGLSRAYGCTIPLPQFRSLDAGGPLTVSALRNGTVQAADLFTTDPAILDNDFVVLDDPRPNFAAQNVVPLINTAQVHDGPWVDVLNEISERLDTPTLRDLNRRYAGPDHFDAVRVAGDWLTAAHIR